MGEFFLNKSLKTISLCKRKCDACSNIFCQLPTKVLQIYFICNVY